MGIQFKPVVEVDKEGKILNYHPSVKEAALFHNFQAGAISGVCNGYIKHHKGKLFRFATRPETKEFNKLIKRTAEIDAAKTVADEPVSEIKIPELPVETISGESILPMEGLSNFEKMLRRNK